MNTLHVDYCVVLNWDTTSVSPFQPPDLEPSDSAEERQCDDIWLLYELFVKSLIDLSSFPCCSCWKSLSLMTRVVKLSAVSVMKRFTHTHTHTNARFTPAFNHWKKAGGETSKLSPPVSQSVELKEASSFLASPGVCSLTDRSAAVAAAFIKLNYPLLIITAAISMFNKVIWHKPSVA